MCPALAQELASLVLEAASGGSLLASLANSSQLGLWSKTSPVVQTSGSMPSVGNWLDSATEAFRSRCARVMSERLTAARGCSSSHGVWATPLASDGTKQSGPSATRQGSESLNEQMKTDNWATPIASASQRGSTNRGRRDLQREVKQNWSTPTASDGKGGAGASPHRNGENLRTQVRNWPTVVVTDSKGSRRNTARTDDWESNPGETLTDALVIEGDMWPTITATPYGSTNNGSPADGREEYATLWTHAKKAGGVLNADWVEALMGVPLGWTADVAPTVDEDADESLALVGMMEEDESPLPAGSSATGSGPPQEVQGPTTGSHLEPSQAKSRETEPD